MKVTKKLGAILLAVAILMMTISVMVASADNTSSSEAKPAGNYIQLDITAGSAADMRDPAFRMGWIGLTAEEGDKLVYDVWVTQNVIGLGGLKITGSIPEESWRNTNDGSDIRNSVLDGKSVNTWYTRTWNLPKDVWLDDLYLTVFHEGDWSATAYYRNIRIVDKDGNVKKVLFNSYYDRIDSQTGLYRFDGNCNDITAQVTMNVPTNVAPGAESYFYLPRQMSTGNDNKCLLDSMTILENTSLLTSSVDATVPYRVNYKVPDTAKLGDTDSILLQPTYTQACFGADGTSKSNFKIRLDITVSAPDPTEGEYIELVIDHHGNVDTDSAGKYRLCCPGMSLPAAEDTGYVLEYDVWIQDPIANVGGICLSEPNSSLHGTGYHEVGKADEHGYYADLRDEAVGHWYTRRLVLSAPQGGLIDVLALALCATANPDMQYETRAYYRNIRILDVTSDLHDGANDEWWATDGLSLYQSYSNRYWDQDSIIRQEANGLTANLFFHVYNKVILGEDYFDPEVLPAASVNPNQTLDAYKVVKGSELIDAESSYKNGLVKLNYNAKKTGNTTLLLQAHYSSGNFVFPDEGFPMPRDSKYYIALHVDITEKAVEPVSSATTAPTTSTTSTGSTDSTGSAGTASAGNTSVGATDTTPSTGVTGVMLTAVLLLLAAGAVVCVFCKKKA